MMAPSRDDNLWSSFRSTSGRLTSPHTLWTSSCYWSAACWPSSVPSYRASSRGIRGVHRHSTLFAILTLLQSIRTSWLPSHRQQLHTLKLSLRSTAIECAIHEYLLTLQVATVRTNTAKHRTPKPQQEARCGRFHYASGFRHLLYSWYLVPPAATPS